MLRAASLMIVGMMLIPLSDVAGKTLTSSGASPVFVAWTRFAIGLVLLLPFLRARHYDLRILADWRVILRGVLISAGVVSILTALKTEPIANVFGAFFVGPVISYALSARLLGERVSAARTALLLVGLVGVLLVLRPGFGMTVGMGYAVLAGVFYGAFLTSSRWLSGVAVPRMLMFSQLAVGAVVLAPPALATMPELDARVVSLVSFGAVCSMSGNLLLVTAYKLTPATRLAPLVYVQLIGATIYGVVFFSELPDGLALLGIGLILASGFGSILLRR